MNADANSGTRPGMQIKLVHMAKVGYTIEKEVAQ